MDCILSQGYEISAVQTLQFDRPSAEEFLEVYNGKFYCDFLIIQLN